MLYLFGHGENDGGQQQYNIFNGVCCSRTPCLQRDRPVSLAKNCHAKEKMVIYTICRGRSRGGGGLKGSMEPPFLREPFLLEIL